MNSTNMKDLVNQVEPNLMAIMAEFNKTLKKYGLTGTRVIDFTLSDQQSPEIEGLVCNFACWVDRQDIRCGIKCEFE